MSKAKTPPAPESDQPTPAATAGVDLAAMAEAAESDYRAMVAELAAGETVDEQRIRNTAVAAGRPLPVMAAHVDRLRQRFEAAEELASLDALQAEINASKSAIGAAESAFETARAEAERMLTQARNAVQEAHEAHSRLGDQKMKRENKAIETLRATAASEIEAKKSAMLKGSGFDRLQASRADRQSAGLPEQQAKRRIEAISEKAEGLSALQLDPFGGMSWD